MATPSSSATSESPPMAFLNAAAASPPTQDDTAAIDPEEREQRKKAVQKFLARAEVSMVTRGLRARLSYASYKATHNIPHVPLRDLEAQSAPRKRKAGTGTNNYYNNPATQGTPATTTPNARGAMAPPTSRASYYNYTGGKDHGAASGSKSASATQSLYSSILAPPPAKQARTVHNAADPPIAAPLRPTPTPRSKASKAGKGKKRQRTAPSGEDDMKAAATLTSLLFHSRPQGQGSPSAGSDSGSAHSWTQFAQSSTRTTTTTAPSASNTEPQSQSQQSSLTQRSATPPPAQSQSQSQPQSQPQQQGTPQFPAPTDNEAADLMLFLATSPSPARPSATRDQAAFRTLRAGARGRVLFAGEQGHKRNRSGEGSFGSSLGAISDIGLNDAKQPSRLAAAPTLPNDDEESGGSGSVNVVPPRTPPQAQLLPPPPLPQSQPFAQSPLPRTHSSPGKAATTPGSSFNLGDFINVSPMPSAGAGVRERRLFEEEREGLGAGIDLVR
ncbi:hypothetical protein PLICRDRAFT_45180 [Plicaturopsis crispa FD-325 SS-3]|uniref:Uncharacterized protein n=1 Tax=Plicaturopsis crispa FD-325 SS-3 TaxID=944288 RepID=A0A0C9T6X0_PLICR|nr:hypothetical protein PLICRDRAFT_45180 [Plicaturopsis crispa FD-325 SS-3]